MGPVSLILGIAELLLWLIGGYVASDYAVGEGYHWLFFVGLIVLGMYFPLHIMRRIEDQRYENVASGSDDPDSASESFSKERTESTTLTSPRDRKSVV